MNRTSARSPRTLHAAFAGILVTLSLPLSAIAAHNAPETVIRTTTDAVLSALANDDLDADAKRAAVETAVVASADIPTIGKLTLAKNWRTFSEDQRARYLSGFRGYVSSTYGRNIDSYSNETVTILSSREEARGDYTVRTKIVRGSAEDILVDYRLRKFDAEWKIIDIIAEGVSMVGNLRSQFQDIVSRKGPEGLIDALAAKAAETESTGHVH